MEEPLGRQLAMTSKVLKERADAVLAVHGASLTTWIVLHHAGRTGTPGLSQKELADNIAIGGPALVRHIDRLEAEGLVRRTRDEHDRRVTRITLTAKGARRIDELSIVIAEQDRLLREQLSIAEARTLQRALTKLHDYALRTITDDASPASSPETDVA